MDFVDWDNVFADDLIKFAALFGIVIYSNSMHHTYQDLVVKILNTGRAIYAFADSSFNYGNSFPFNNGIVLDDMANHSSKTLCQLIARAGRPGVSDSAIIYAGDRVLQVIENSIYDSNFFDIELFNLKKSLELSIEFEKERIRIEFDEIEKAERKEIEEIEKAERKEREEFEKAERKKRNIIEKAERIEREEFEKAKRIEREEFEKIEHNEREEFEKVEKVEHIVEIKVGIEVKVKKHASNNKWENVFSKLNK